MKCRQSVIIIGKVIIKISGTEKPPVNISDTSNDNNNNKKKIQH